MGIQANEVEHLYVHVPFCAAKCNYCAFYSEADSAARMGDYVDAVLAELEGHAPSWPPGENGRDGARPSNTIVLLRPTTIFFGGGTPSLLPVPLLRRLLEGIRRTLSLTGVREWTVESNPATVSTGKAKLLREFGVNRISMGVQAFDDGLLKRIGRIHSVKTAVQSYEKLRTAGFDNINLDLIFGLPGQTSEQWRATLRRAIELQPEHLSTYCLILEEGTKLLSFCHGASVPLTTDDEQLAMYETAMEILAAAGYRQYEISNFAKPGRECVHNIACWEGRDYIGLGPSACSTVGDRRWQNVADIGKYVEGVRSQESEVDEVGRAAIYFEEILTPELRAAERAAFGMRMIDGVPAELVRGRWDREIAGLLRAGLAQWHKDRLKPTHRGILFADEIAAEFV